MMTSRDLLRTFFLEIWTFQQVWATDDGTDDVYLGTVKKVKKDNRLIIFY